MSSPRSASPSPWRARCPAIASCRSSRSWWSAAARRSTCAATTGRNSSPAGSSGGSRERASRRPTLIPGSRGRMAWARAFTAASATSVSTRRRSLPCTKRRSSSSSTAAPTTRSDHTRACTTTPPPRSLNAVLDLTGKHCHCTADRHPWLSHNPGPKNGGRTPSALTFATPFSLLLPLRSPAGDHDAVAALPLRLIHRRIGARDQLLRRLPVRRILGGTHAHRHPPATEFFSRHAGPEALAHGGGRRDRRLDQHDQELLTAVTGHAVDAPCGLAQDLRDLHEHRVPPKVPVRVVVP